jgi:hypothetical protein
VPAEAPSASTYYNRQPSRKALVVFDFGGSAQKDVPPLVVVDAGRDFVGLRAKYPDQARYLIITTLIRARVNFHLGSKSPVVEGWCDLLANRIHVPQPYARTLQELRGKGSYHLTLCYGKRLEPWVCGCRP